jgi:pSer/pThr/pTyr-binding forkhead associated (FHA) protein
MDNILGGAISAPGSSTSQPGGGGLGIVLVALVAVGAATWIVVLNRGKTDQAGVGLTKATLIGAGGERIPLHKTNVMIGRGSSSDIRLSGNAVSRQHARLRFAQGDWYLQDQNSAGGTFVNGVRQAACKLRSGDQIMIGGQTFQFIIGSS